MSDPIQRLHTNDLELGATEVCHIYILPMGRFCHYRPLSQRHTGGDQAIRMHSPVLDGSKVRREPVILRLSREASYLLKELCVSIAACVTFLCTWESCIALVSIILTSFEGHTKALRTSCCFDQACLSTQA